jgi:ferritin
MLNKEMETALNSQLNAELYSGYLYLSMAAYFEDNDLSGFANWMQVQAQEELSHGMKFYEYIVQRTGRVVLDEIEKPQKDWKDPITTFEHVLAHEQTVSGLINDLVDLAIEERDHATNNFLQWFVAEQVEEEESAGDILSKVKLASESSNGLYLLDNELAQRVYTPPADGK